MRRWLAMLVVVGVTAAVMWPVVGHEFVHWDDPHNFVTNPWIKSDAAEARRQIWLRPYKDLWVPVTYTVWRAAAGVARLGDGSLHPLVFHGLNFALHLVAAAGVFELVRRVVGKEWAACAGALVFAVHPAQVEPVAWASGTKDVLAGMFGAWALVLHVAHLGAPAWWRRWGAVGLLVLALLSKPSAMVLVGMAAAVEWFWFAPRRSVRDMVGSFWPWVVVTLPVMIVAKFVQPAGDVVVAWWARPIVALDSLGFYVLKVIVPVNFAIDYGRAPAWVLSSWQKWGTGAVALAALVLAFAARKRWPLVAAGAAMFVMALGPMLGLVAFDFQRVSTVADHYLYMGMAGVGLAAGAAIDRIPKRFAAAAGVVAVALLSLVAHLQTRAWSDSETLFAHAILVNPTSVVANVNLGNRRLEEARLGWRDGRLGDATTRAEEAMVHYRQALRAHPDDVLARRGAAKAMGLIGAVSAREGRIEEAVPQLLKALEYDPDDAENRGNLEKVLRNRGGAGTPRR